MVILHVLSPFSLYLYGWPFRANSVSTQSKLTSLVSKTDQDSFMSVSFLQFVSGCLVRGRLRSRSLICSDQLFEMRAQHKIITLLRTLSFEVENQTEAIYWCTIKPGSCLPTAQVALKASLNSSLAPWLIAFPSHWNGSMHSDKRLDLWNR